MQTKYWQTDSLEAHMALVRRQVDRGLNDPETRQLAVRLVSGAHDFVEDGRSGRRVPVIRAWDHYLHAPDFDCKTKDDMCEVALIWSFVVLNCRYTYDPAGVDTFGTLKVSLDAHGGDCDDAVIALGTLLKAVGFEEVYARVISTDGKNWEHTYIVVGLPKERGKKYLALDVTVPGKPMGWEYEDIRKHKDFPL